jgi:hypothetical protein
MFEQSYYQQPMQSPTSDADLFKDYEIRNWDIGPRVYKIIGISLAANLFALLVVAQTSLLTMKGCDSPLVGRVCTVLDTVYVSTMLFGTDREMIDAEYDRTKIEDSEITFVDVTGVTPPLSYPEGYFQIANPEQFQASVIDPVTGMPIPSSGMPDIDDNAISSFPQFPQNSGSDLLNTPQVLPQTNPNVVTGDLPSFGGSSTYTPPKPARTPRVKIPKNLPPDIDDNAVAQVKPSPSPTAEALPTPMTSEQVNAVEINKRPLIDFADNVATQWSAKEVDISQDFTVVLNGVLDAKGALDPKKSQYDAAKQKGDEKMIAIGKAALEALGQSGYLNYLKSLNVEKFNAVLSQDDKNVTVVITSPQKSEAMANTIMSGLNTYISIGKLKVDNPSDERTLLDGAKVTAQGKNFILNFAIPKPIAQEMINRKLTESQAKKATQPKPSGENGTSRTGDKSASK